MAVDLAGAILLRFHVRDNDGKLVNASGAVTATITLPDDSTTMPAVTNPDTGVYLVDYTTVQAGRHTVRWVATDPDRAWVDVFDVRSAAGIALVGLDTAKRHLKIPKSDITQDDNLRGFLDSVTDVVQGITGMIVRQSITETHHGRNVSGVCLLRRPVLSVTSVSEHGVILDPDEYSLSDAGVLYRVSGFAEAKWRKGVNNIVIIYVVGRTAVQPSIMEGALELIRINYRPQLGGNYSAFDGGRSDDFGTDSNLGPQGQYRLGFFIPNRVMQLLAPHNEGPGLA